MGFSQNGSPLSATELLGLQADLGLLVPAGGLCRFKANIEVGADATILFVTDSTGIVSPTRRYPAQWADQLSTLIAMASPGVAGKHSIDVLDFSLGYTSPARVYTGSTSAVIRIYVFAISGAVPRYMMGPYWRRGVVLPDADALFLGHGINLKNYADGIAGEYVSFIEYYRMMRPRVPIIATTQHPNRANDSHESFRSILLKIGGKLGITIRDDVFQEYLSLGKPVSLYDGDDVHESTDTGCALYVADLNDLYTRAIPTLAYSLGSTLNQCGARQNLLVNGAYTDYSSGTPASWSASGSISFALDESVYFDDRKPSSLRITGGGSGATQMTQQVSGGRLAELQGATVTLMAMIRKDAAAASTVGRIGLTYTSTSQGSVNINSAGYNIQQGEWQPYMVTANLPNDVTALTARVYHDSSATPDATYGLNLDQVMLMTSLAPMWAR